MMQFTLEGDVAVLAFDDGKANVIGNRFIDEINDSLDRAEQEAKAVVVTGRKDRFSAGFDLEEFKQGPEATQKLLQRGAEMLLRVFSYPLPVVAACTGHAIAAGAFLLLASDTRIGTKGDFKIGLNETAIGMAIPVFGQELAIARLSKRHLTPAFVQATLYDPSSAVDAGFLDDTVEAENLLSHSMAIATQLASISGDAYAKNKQHSRATSIQRIKDSLS